MSSARVIGNCQMMLYQDNHYRGAGVCINTGEANLKIINGDFNDKASSVTSICFYKSANADH